jgi:hypothetical protein
LIRTLGTRIIPMKIERCENLGGDPEEDRACASGELRDH